MKLIDKDALVAEIERIKEMYCYDTKTNASFVAEAVINSTNNAINSLEVKEVDLESYNKLKRTLSLAFMNFLDSNRREGKMCLSNGECYDIDKAFDELNFAKLFRYMEKYLKAQKGE